MLAKRQQCYSCKHNVYSSEKVEANGRIFHQVRSALLRPSLPPCTNASRAQPELVLGVVGTVCFYSFVLICHLLNHVGLLEM